MKYSVLVAEDDPMIREMIIDFIQLIPDLYFIESTDDANLLGTILKQKSFDLLIFDIQLKNINILEILKKFSNLSYIIFITSFENFAIKAYEMGAIDYILKPVSFERFSQSINRFLNYNQVKNKQYVDKSECNLIFKFHEILHTIPCQKIIYIAASKRNTVIFTEDEQFISPFGISELSEKLASNKFIRIHKSYILNSASIKQLIHKKSGLYDVLLNDIEDTRLPVGRKYVSNIKELF